jgi:hypothetical protein
MALTIDTVGRDNEVAGQTFLVLLDGSSRRIQTFAVVDENGAQSGIAGAPFVVSIEAGTAWASDTAGTAVNGELWRSGAGSLKEVRVLLDPSVVNPRWLMLFDTTTLPVNGATPTWRALIPPAGEISESLPGGEFSFTTGCYAMISSTIDTLTTVGAEAFFHVRGVV